MASSVKASHGRQVTPRSPGCLLRPAAAGSCRYGDIDMRSIWKCRAPDDARGEPEKSKHRKAVMTRAEKDRHAQTLLAGYGQDVGKAIVGDDSCLVRLLATLRLDREDAQIGAYLCSFLVA